MRTLKQVAINMADAFTRFGLWKGGGNGGGNVNVQIKELWSGQQSTSGTLTLLDDYSNYDIIISMIEPTENYPTQQKYDFMLKGGTSLTGGICENNNYIAQYRLKDWNGTNVYYLRDTSTGGWNVTLRKIWGLKFVSQQHEYSTEEKVVGKWIDGRYVYEKIIPFSATLNSNVWTSIPELINDKEILIKVCGINPSYAYSPLFGNIEKSIYSNVQVWNMRNYAIDVSYILIQYVKSE